MDYAEADDEFYSAVNELRHRQRPHGFPTAMENDLDIEIFEIEDYIAGLCSQYAARGYIDQNPISVRTSILSDLGKLHSQYPDIAALGDYVDYLRLIIKVARLLADRTKTALKES